MNTDKHYWDEVKVHFGFLETDFGFKKFPSYCYVREVHHDFIKNNLIIKLIFESTYLIEILASEQTEAEILNFEKKTIDYDYNHFQRYDLKNLDPGKKIFNSLLSNKKNPMKDLPDCASDYDDTTMRENTNQILEEYRLMQLKYFEMLLRDNPEILKGDFSKLSKFSLEYWRKVGFNLFHFRI